MQGLVIELPKSVLFFGPPPKTKDDLRYLIEDRGIKCIVNLSPQEDEKAERYMKHCKVDEKNPEKTLHVGLIRLCLDATSFDPQGRNKELKKESRGHFYANHVKSVEKELVDVKGGIYIHHTTGATEEAYIAFGLWRSRYPNDKLDFLTWIRENDYEWIFDDDNDKKELLSFVLNEVDKQHRRISFFKKIKKDE
jgi:hypothetical protein